MYDYESETREIEAKQNMIHRILTEKHQNGYSDDALVKEALNLCNEYFFDGRLFDICGQFKIRSYKRWSNINYGTANWYEKLICINSRKMKWESSSGKKLAHGKEAPPVDYVAAVQETVEHEICHMVDYGYFGSSGHHLRFRTLLYKYFRHICWFVNAGPTQNKTALKFKEKRDKIAKNQAWEFKVSDIVFFEKDYKILQGIVTATGALYTIDVPEPNYKYTSYKVPATHLYSARAYA